jgi:hypothetical protein
MNLENSLLKVLTIWTETFKNTREPLTESEVKAYFRLSFYHSNRNSYMMNKC